MVEYSICLWEVRVQIPAAAELSFKISTAKCSAIGVNFTGLLGVTIKKNEDYRMHKHFKIYDVYLVLHGLRNKTKFLFLDMNKFIYHASGRYIKISNL